jgi:SOS-response transcriptional repressor LexA
MNAVSFVRTTPNARETSSPNIGEICTSCGSYALAQPMHGNAYHNPLSLDALLLRHPANTYFVEVGAPVRTAEQTHTALACVSVPTNDFLGIAQGDILTIDRSMAPCLGHLVLAVHEGAFVVGRFTEHEGTRFLVAESGERHAHELTKDGTTYLWGIVTAIVKRL